MSHERRDLKHLSHADPHSHTDIDAGWLMKPGKYEYDL